MPVWLGAFISRPYILVIAFLILVPCTPARAAGTGQIAGTVTDARTGAPLANAAISVSSPSDRYHTTTDANGRFSLAGVTVDTYTISTEKQGYGTFGLAGVT